jgi:hypothetical protein
MKAFSLSNLFLALTLALLPCGCKESADSRYDSGYSDGYASGYNTTLKIRSTLVEGDWDDKNYKRGYDDGYAEGVSVATKEAGD